MTQSPSETAEGPDASQFVDADRAAEAYAKTSAIRHSSRTFDEVLADLAIASPGYAGHYKDDEGTMHILLTSDASKSRTIRAMNDLASQGVLLGPDDYDVSNVIFEPAKYDFVQLYMWTETLLDPVFELNAISSLDIDETRNRIVVGLTNLSASSDVARIVGDLGIPGDVVTVRKDERPVPTITNERDTQGGGLQIEFVVPEGDRQCTMGPLTRRNGNLGFLTNAHCSENRFSVENEKFYNAWKQDRHVGTEAADPPYFTDGSCPSFDYGYVCAWADALWADWISGNGTKYTLGYLYRTSYRGRSTGSFSRVTNNFWITAENGNVSVGDEVNKVGIGTGWTYGYVKETCVHLVFPSDRSYSDPVRMPCQTKADYGTDLGDSGAPIFAWDQSGSDVTLVGMSWGMDDSLGWGNFSSVNMIHAHFGNDTLEFF